jgi:hypothetical protein
MQTRLPGCHWVRWSAGLERVNSRCVHWRRRRKARWERRAADGKGWFLFAPKPDNFAESPIDLRFLNEKFAGEHGFVEAKDGRFIHAANGHPVRFWAVNGPAREDKDRAALRQTARVLAKRGVNLVRRHGAIFDKDGELDPAAVKSAIAVVEEMKPEGIYTHLSIYFPLWFTPRADHPWMEGYDGRKHPFAALMFNPKFQEKYRGWWKAPSPRPAKPPAKRSLLNPRLRPRIAERGFVLLTFNPDSIPDPQLRILESQFAAWLAEAWLAATASPPEPESETRRAGRRPCFVPSALEHVQRKVRDQETAAFLLETQTKFYRDTVTFLRQLGFKVDHVQLGDRQSRSFWTVEKLSYTTGDFIDRHGYFESNHKGDNAALSIRLAIPT